MSMLQIGLLSDTHCTLNPRILEFFNSCDEIWHAGDFGDIETVDKLTSLKLLRAVYGNIDGHSIRTQFSKYQTFMCEDIKVLMTHIGGYPGRYEKEAKQMIEKEKPGLFISGHSHILKVIFDNRYNMLHINPGAAGNSGYHLVITCVRFVIDGKDIRDLEVLEIQRETKPGKSTAISI